MVTTKHVPVLVRPVLFLPVFSVTLLTAQCACADEYSFISVAVLYLCHVQQGLLPDRAMIMSALIFLNVNI